MSLEHAVHRLAADYHGGSRLALLFDYDGTLTPVVTHPALAALPDAARQLLLQFANLTRVEVGVISGRSLADLKAIIGLPQLTYAGTCGLEFDGPDAVLIHSRASQHRPYLDHAAACLGEITARYAGAWIEQKPLGLTMHYRAVSRDDVPFLWQDAEEAMQRYEGLLTATDGSKALEILPDVGWDKGRTVQLFVDRYREPVTVLYAGNDANDAPALQLVNDMAGLSIGVGPYAPLCARYRLADTLQLAERLWSLLDLLVRVQGVKSQRP